ncbi:hypothetical protein BDZ89DRAFT_534043 [Hymenopellis radicata]|nr:hypothetical protein BDZ89DRAFT_534043 [Hymenopellis radicata]
MVLRRTLNACLGTLLFWDTGHELDEEHYYMPICLCSCSRFQSQRLLTTLSNPIESHCYSLLYAVTRSTASHGVQSQHPNQ